MVSKKENMDFIFTRKEPLIRGAEVCVLTTTHSKPHTEDQMMTENTDMLVILVT